MHIERFFMVKLQFDLNKQYKITLPKALIDAKGWKKGDQIKVVLDSQGNIVLVRDQPIEQLRKNAVEIVTREGVEKK
jgi:bifunctional DNA-binding transcriptional regulator/antitoxin component of YhaV-PrlF toxin-antitoxin module